MSERSNRTMTTTIAGNGDTAAPGAAVSTTGAGAATEAAPPLPGATTMGRSSGSGLGWVSKTSGNSNTPSSSSTAAPIRRRRAWTRAWVTAALSCGGPVREETASGKGLAAPRRPVRGEASGAGGASPSVFLRLKNDGRAMFSRDGGRPAWAARP
jgi:hypothetical protein